MTSFQKLGKVVLGLVALLAALIGAGQWARLRNREILKTNYPPPGLLVDIGGYRLHLDCQGQGEPVVVMETGFASIALLWSQIRGELAKTTRVCVYDRAGYGWSNASPRPRTVENMVEELHTLLKNGGVQGPYVLAGNSMGGLVIRRFAHRYPEDAAGLVLVDSAHEEQFQRLGVSANPLAKTLFRLLPAIVRTGIPALFPALLPVPEGLPPEVAQAFRILATTEPLFAETAAAEFLALERSHAELRAARIESLGEIPLTVLSHGKTGGLAVRLGLLPPEKQQQVQETFLELQRELADQSTKGRLVIAEESGHNIELQQPELVVAAILDMVAALRAGNEAVRSSSGGVPGP
jgi:pimeloyl-ACP methyl ester carboxylesterase